MAGYEGYAPSSTGLESVILLLN